MAEFWQPIHTRALQTLGVWNLQPTFTVGALSRTAHAGNAASVLDSVTDRDTEQDAVDIKLSARDANSRKIRDANLRVAALIDANLDDEHPLSDQLDAVYAVDVTSEQGNMERGRKLISLWTLVDADRAAQTPALPLIVLGTLTRAGFETLVDAQPGIQQQLEDERAVLSTKRNALRAAARVCDKGNKKWYRAWSAAFADGTPEHDALTQIDTGDAQQEPEALEIAALTPQSGGMVLVSYIPDGGDGATELQLVHQVVGTDANFGHAAQMNLAGQSIGPFTAGQTVNVKTVASNSAGSTDGAVKSITL